MGGWLLPVGMVVGVAGLLGLEWLFHRFARRSGMPGKRPHP